MIRFFSMSQFHNKNPISGSTFIRVHQLLKYWPGSALYKYGENPEVLIFQKVYCGQDYKFPAHFEGIKILDICDPDWLEGVAIKETVDAMDAITVPTKPLADFISQMTDKPIVIIPDRFDMALIGRRHKKHTGKAKTIGWFGYAHNVELIRPALPLINELSLTLHIISNENKYLFNYPNSVKAENYRFTKYNESTIYQDLQQMDFVIFPEGKRIIDKYKSNNRTTKAILAGLPVATTPAEVQLFLDGPEREKYIQKHYNKTKAEYDVKKSVQQFKDLIDEIATSKRA